MERGCRPVLSYWGQPKNGWNVAGRASHEVANHLRLLLAAQSGLRLSELTTLTREDTHQYVEAELEGENAIARNREIMGATNPKEAAPGTIRADFAETVDENAVHGSDGPDTAKAGVTFFFPEGVCERTR